MTFLATVLKKILFLLEEKGGKRSALITPRLLQLKDLVQDATGFSGTDLLGVYNYGCWCGPRGEGKIVDNFD